MGCARFPPAVSDGGHATIAHQMNPKNLFLPALGPLTPAEPAVFMGDFGFIVIARSTRSWVSHIHREHQMNFHVEGGDAVISNGHDQYLLRQGECNFHNPWATHSVRVDAGKPCVFVTINISPVWLAARRGVPSDRLPLFKRMHATMSPATRALVDTIVAKLLAERALSAALADIGHLLDQVFDMYGDSGSLLAEELPASETARRIQRSLDFIESKAVGKIRINEVAAFAGMSRSHFFREFTNRFGTSPLRVIDAVRISWAVERLLTTDTPIAELGDELGFSTPSHFGRFFASHIGLTPSEYRGPWSTALHVGRRERRAAPRRRSL
jgi:AraC-like DNA-binding protein